MKKLLIFLCIPFLLAACTTQKTPEKVTLNYWGVYEPAENMEEIIRDYQAAHPNVTINYTRKGLKEYKQQVIARVGRENGPDIFRYHNSWVPEVRPYLSITPTATLQEIDFKKTFYPVVDTDLAANRGYYGIPLMYDGLGLFYNKQLFRDRGLIKPPETWNDVIDTAKSLTANNGGKLTISGLAIGSTDNVDYWPDIMALLMYQNNVSIKNPNQTPSETETSIKFFKELISDPKVWDKSEVASTDAFAQGRAAMMFGTSWTAFEIQSKNPNLEFAVAPVPQVPGTKLGIASYWVEGVANNISKAKQEESWKFLTFLASKENQQRLYAIQGKTRLFGEPPSRVDLASEVESNEYLKGILETASVARSTYINDKTFGGGFNTELTEEYKKLINGGSDARRISTNIQGIYTKYKAQ